MSRTKSGIAFLIGATLLAPVYVGAETRLTHEGVADHMDKGHRNPVLTVGSSYQNGSAKILADAYVINKEYQRFPIQFDFYVNGKLFSSQVRSPELPRAVGIDVGADIAAPPFNYTVVAKLLFPNRSFTSVIQAAVFASDLSASLDCSLTLTAQDDSTTDYSATAVQFTQSSNSAFSLSFAAKTDDGAKQADVNGAVEISSGAASGTLNISTDDIAVPTGFNGTAAFDSSGKLTSLELESTDASTALSCG